MTSPTPAETVICYTAVTEKKPVGRTGLLSVRLLPGGLLMLANAPVNVKVYDVSGCLVQSLLVERETKVALRPGVYFVRPKGGRALKAAVR